MKFLCLAAALLVGGAAAATSSVADFQGAYTDPNHYVSDESLAGTRFVAFPAQSNTTTLAKPDTSSSLVHIVGTDDGKTWWHLVGAKSASSPTSFVVDFGPKIGVPRAIKFTGTPQRDDDDSSYIVWNDGNKWSRLATPTPAMTRFDGLLDHIGLVFEGALFQPTGFAGLAALAEFPPHVLTQVYTLDGTTWVALVGTCSGPKMTQINLGVGGVWDWARYTLAYGSINPLFYTKKYKGDGSEEDSTLSGVAAKTNALFPAVVGLAVVAAIVAVAVKKVGGGGADALDAATRRLRAAARVQL